MTHFAEIDPVTKIVKRVIVIEQSEIDTGRWGNPDNWIQTSYNTKSKIHSQNKTPLRKNYAGIGFTYDSDLDAFIPPNNYPSWTLDNDKGVYKAPIPRPNVSSTGMAIWNEDSGEWDVYDLT